MFSQTFLAFSSAIVRNIKSFNCSGNSKSLSAMKTLSHFERVKSFEEEVARLMVTNWISLARVLCGRRLDSRSCVWKAARSVGWGMRAGAGGASVGLGHGQLR